MVKGNFLLSQNDLSVGTGEFPSSLGLTRSYTSSLKSRNSSMGRGWMHNFESSVRVNSDGLQGMGEDSALDAASALVEKMVSLDLLSDNANPLDKVVIAAVGQRWFGDQITNNTVIVQQGLNSDIFVKLADGSYNAPPKSAIAPIGEKFHAPKFAEKMRKVPTKSTTKATVQKRKFKFFILFL